MGTLEIYIRQRRDLVNQHLWLINAARIAEERGDMRYAKPLREAAEHVRHASEALPSPRNLLPDCN